VERVLKHADDFDFGLDAGISGENVHGIPNSFDAIREYLGEAALSGD